MNIYYELTDNGPRRPFPRHLGLDEQEALGLIHAHVQLGLWRADLDSGHVFFSSETNRIFGLDQTDGPVDLAQAQRAIHPEDIPVALELLETLAREKGAYQFVQRVADGKGGYKFVRVVGRYRAQGDGAGEIIGICHEIPQDG